MLVVLLEYSAESFESCPNCDPLHSVRKKKCDFIVLKERNATVLKPLVRTASLVYSLELALHCECDLRIGQNTVHNQHL